MQLKQYFTEELVCCTYNLTLEKNRLLGCFPLRWGVNQILCSPKLRQFWSSSLRKKKKKAKQLIFTNFTKIYDPMNTMERFPHKVEEKLSEEPLGLSLVTFTANSLLAKCMLLWKLLIMPHFSKFMKRLFGFDPWGQVIL